jgi:hypothetical protein
MDVAHDVINPAPCSGMRTLYTYEFAFRDAKGGGGGREETGARHGRLDGLEMRLGDVPWSPLPIKSLGNSFKC